VSSDAIYQRLAAIAVELERLSASGWLLEREREELRTELRRQNAIADGQVSARPAR
jgi:hypothetical protein